MEAELSAGICRRKHPFDTASFGAASFGIDPGEEAVSPYWWSRGFQKLDVVALTHAHQDHLGGLAAVLEDFHVGKLWIGREFSSPALAKLEQLARDRRIPMEHEFRGKSFDRDGAVHVLTDGSKLEIHCFVACLGACKTASTLAKVPNQK